MALVGGFADFAAQMTTSTPSLTQARAVAILTELLEAFKSKSFQKKLEKLVTKGSGAAVSGPLRHVEGRRALVFRAQRDILLKHGFLVNEAGVVAMKAALRAHLDDPKIRELSREARKQLRVPQMRLPATIALCAASDDFSFIASPEAADTSEPLPASPSPAGVPPQQASIAVRIEPKITCLTIDVTNPETKETLVVTVPKPLGRYPTVGEVKSAISAHLDEGGSTKGSVDASTFQLVISIGGGVYGTRGDKETVRLDRVSALGFSVAAAGA